ncbi:hypothetical protein YQE_06428, partial [Dendroctonus ponderosae]
MTDPSKRPLAFPKWHIPYLEKHRIPELFHELARELLIQKPEDHILFMKQMLQQAAANRDACRTILIGSLKVNRVAVAQEMAKSTQQLVITLQDLKRIFPLAAMQPEMVAKAIACLGRSQHSGWILADCINTEQEAKALLQLGVLPTHVVHLVAPFQPKLDEPLYCDVPEHWPALRRNLFGLRGLFAQKLREVCLADRSIAAAAKDCLDICRRKPAVKAVRPRVVILGPRGCGRKTQARLLAQMMGLIHVDFEYILCQAWTNDNQLGRQLRQCNKRVCFHSELLCQIVNKRVLERDCMESGWVLTGYPFTVTDFQFLDCLQTPPNRVIVLDCDLNTAKERLRYRQVNVHTGSVTDFNPAKVGESRAAPSKGAWRPHPKDFLGLIQAEHDFYCQNYGSIKKYCGDTMLVVNGEQSERWVFECIVGHLVGSSPPGAARKGFGPDIPEVCSCECINVPSKVAKAYAMTL